MQIISALVVLGTVAGVALGSRYVRVHRELGEVAGKHYRQTFPEAKNAAEAAASASRGVGGTAGDPSVGARPTQKPVDAAAAAAAAPRPAPGTAASKSAKKAQDDADDEEERR